MSNIERSGRILVVSGPSGCGKTTLVKRLLEADAELVWSVSATTRQPREGEVEGRDYHFLSRAQFEQGIQESGFAEYAESFGELYGTPKAPLNEALTEGKVIVLDIDVQGARQIKRSFGEAFRVFVTAPSEEELLRRLENRGTEDAVGRKRRTERVRQEMAAQHEYDRVIVNDQVDRAFDELESIVAELKKSTG